MKSANRLTAERIAATARAAHPCLARGRRGCLCIGCREFRAAARDVLETMGIIEPGGDTVLPDFGEENADTPIAKARAAARREREREGPHQLIERPPQRETVPTGLRALPPAPSAPAAKKSLPPHDGTRLGRDLAELEAADPKVAAAARSLDETVQRINGRPRPTVADLGLLKPPQPERAPEPAVPATRTPAQPPAPPMAAADGPAVAGTTAQPDTSNPKRRRTRPAKCGTPGGEARHYRAGEKPCEACRLARNADRVERERARGVKPRPEPSPHGTPAAAKRHLARGERPLREHCEPCADALRLYQRDRYYARQKPAPAAEPSRSDAVGRDCDEWLAAAQDSAVRAVNRKAAVAIAALLQLRTALDDLARAERDAARRTA